MHGSEESYELKRTFWLASLAAVAAAIIPLAAAAQVASDTGAESAPHPVAVLKYKAFVGLGYTSINQVTQSRHGLLGGKVGVTRDWGRYFGLRLTADYDKPSAGSGNGANPGNPSVYSVLAGPELHAPLYDGVGGLLFAELGTEHTGGENMSPNTSFAGGWGGGLTYDLNPKWGIEVTGDRVAGSFSESNNTPQQANSPHVTWNSRGTVGVFYRF